MIEDVQVDSMQNGLRLVALKDIRDQVFMKAASHIIIRLPAPVAAGVMII